MNKSLVKTALISLLFCGCHPVPATAAPHTMKQMMREQASQVCKMSTVTKDIMPECVELISDDYYDAAMLGGRVLSVRGYLSPEMIAEHATKYLNCNPAYKTCKINRQNYATWMVYGRESVSAGDKGFIRLMKAYYE